MKKTRKKQLEKFSYLLDIMDNLRENCPWDKEQTFKTLKNLTIEETYELSEAIISNNFEEIKNELGDLLLQTVYHTQIAEEENLFNFNDVINQISEKMIQRHPHVFGEENRNKSASQQIKDWESIKAKERAQKNQTGVLDDVAINLPALVRSIKLQKRAARVGFDWPDILQVLEKIDEETRELVEAKQHLSQDKINEEFGDLLFSIVNLGRHLGVDSEEALKKTNRKFTERFRFIEDSISSRGLKIEETPLEEMEDLWQISKKALSN